MKILPFCTLALCAAFCFSACGKASTSSCAPPITGIPNPMVSVDSAAAFDALGFTIDAPANAKDIDYFIIDKSLAQVDFTLDDIIYCYRASKTTEDISGVYANFDRAARHLSCKRGDVAIEIDIKRIIGDMSGFVAAWQDGDVMHSLYAKSALPEETFNSVCLALATKTDAQPASSSVATDADAKRTAAHLFVQHFYEEMGKDTHFKTFTINDISVIAPDTWDSIHVTGVPLDQIWLSGESGLTWAQYLQQKDAQLVMALFTYTYTDAALAAAPQFAEGENLQFSLVTQDEKGNCVIVDQSMRAPAVSEQIK